MTSAIRFKTRHHASFQEIDSYGHLNTVHYISYFLTHRFTALRERFQLDLQKVAALPIAFYTKSLTVDFMRPVIGDRPFEIESHVSELAESSCKVTCEMFDERGKPLAKSVMHLVCVDKATLKPCAWPAGFMELFYE